MTDHREIIQLIIAYTLTGALIFTVVITCLSLVGWVKFADAKQQSKLFYVLIVELVVVAVGFYSQLLKFDPIEVRGNISAQATDQVLAALRDNDQRNSANIRLFWKPNEKVDPSHEAVLRQWLAAHGFDTGPGSLTMFLYSDQFVTERAQMMHDLGLDRRRQ